MHTRRPDDRQRWGWRNGGRNNRRDARSNDGGGPRRGDNRRRSRCDGVGRPPIWGRALGWQGHLLGPRRRGQRSYRRLRHDGPWGPRQRQDLPRLGSSWGRSRCLCLRRRDLRARRWLAPSPGWGHQRHFVRDRQLEGLGPQPLGGKHHRHCNETMKEKGEPNRVRHLHQGKAPPHRRQHPAIALHPW